MSKLIPIDNFKSYNNQFPKLHPALYFIDAYFSRTTNSWQFTIEKNYPYVAIIHVENLDEFITAEKEETRKFWINLRKWAERNCIGDVLFEYKNMDYSWWWNREAKGDWDKAYSKVKHGYWYFYFECESDYTMFALMHGEKLSKVQMYHPNFGKDVLEQDKIYGKVT